MENLSTEKIPRHIAIIMDGNGRWAGKRLLSRINGHRRGIEVAKEMVTCCRELGIECLTLYTFSKENWSRPLEEVGLLMTLLQKHLKSECASMMENNIRFRAIGSIEDLPDRVRAVIDEVERKTNDNGGMVLQLALSYSGRQELVEAAKKLAEAVQGGKLAVDDITEDTFKEYLYTKDVPDPDLLIRTSGECRISNFLLWQLAYTEIHITDVLWPDFTKEHLMEAILDFQRRERRFGLVGSQKVGVVG